MLSNAAYLHLIRLFLSTAALVGCLVTAGFCLVPIILGRVPPSIAGLALAFAHVDWAIVAIVAGVVALLRVLSKFEFFQWLADLFYWIEVLFKAFR